LTLAGWRLDHPNERKLKMKKVSIALMALGLLLVSGCTPQPASLTVDDLYGVWMGRGFTQFNENGTWAAARSADEFTSQPLQFGDFRLEGTTLILITDKESVLCANTTASYELEMAEDGSRIKSTLIEDPCPAGGAKIPSFFYTRIEP
jgi:hypothetical protein